MSELTSQPWFGWTLAVVIGLPLTLLILTEIHSALARRGSRMARPVNLLRNYVVPAGALLILVINAADISVEVTWVRVLATAVGLLLIILSLSVIKVAMFGYAETGSWRRRLPSIFIDLSRLILILIGLGILLSWVWGTDVGGLFAALGVTSIIIGLALQNSVGGIISGLLLLFEQPFALGDWLETNIYRDTVRGRIVEVNWRAVHVQTDDGIYIVPNAMLATQPFRNLSRPQGNILAAVMVKFASGDPPDEVLTLLERTADQLPRVDRRQARVLLTPQGSYQVLLPVSSPAEIGATTAVFQRWLWYASRRSGLHLDGAAPDEFSTPERVEQTLASIAGTLQLSAEDAAELAPSMRLDRYAAGETLVRAGERPANLSVVTAGRVALTISPGGDGDVIRFEHVGLGEPIGLSALTGELSRVTATAAEAVTVLQIPITVLDTLLRNRPQLARQLSDAMDEQRRAIATTLSASSAGSRPVRSDRSL